MTQELEKGSLYSSSSVNGSMTKKRQNQTETGNQFAFKSPSPNATNP